MTLDESIQRAEHLTQWIGREINGMEIDSGSRNALAVGCFDTALEHQRAIVLLIAKGIPGSAFALARSLFEAYIRGLWLSHCASEAQLDRFFRNKDVGVFSELLESVGKIDGFEGGALQDVKTRAWAAMNSYTHTGISQVSRRHGDGGFIEANYSDNEKIEVLNFACGIGWMAAIALCNLAGDIQRANSILQKIKELFPKS